MLAVQGLCFILLMVGLVPYSESTGTGCEIWTLSDQDVCCNKCKPGNRLVTRCGRDPKMLCTPCEPKSYTTQPKSSFCHKCTQCIGPQFTLKPCNISSDTECGCKKGYRCGNKECSFCVTECGEGEEPTDQRSCRKCSQGTFNDKVHSMCKKWRKSCPEEHILVPKGNAFKDHECRSLDLESTKNPLNVVKKGETKFATSPVWTAGGLAGLGVLCIIVSVVACVQAQNKTEKNLKTDIPEEVSEFSRNMIVEQDACSFHHPEQEQGGSSESISTQDSESKLIV